MIKTTPAALRCAIRGVSGLLLLLASCAAQPSLEQFAAENIPAVTFAAPKAETAAPETSTPPPIQIENAAVPLASTSPLPPSEKSEEAALLESDTALVHLWPVQSVLDPAVFEVNFGIPAGDPVCGENPAADLPEPDGEIILTLGYAAPLLPQQVNLVHKDHFDGILRIELLNSFSGVGEILYEAGQPIHPEKLPGSPCAEIISIPMIESEKEIDTIIISFSSLAAVAQLDAVELVGRFRLFSDLPAFWRIPIPSDSAADPTDQIAGGLAVDDLNMLFLANGSSEFYRYDVEGNWMQTYSGPPQSRLSDIAVDAYGSIVITDSVSQKFITRFEDGSPLNTGGEDFGENSPREAAISPYNGNIYLLDEADGSSRIRVYTGDTADFIQDIPLENEGSYGYRGLAFDSEGCLYTIDQSQTAILKIDSIHGEILDTLGLPTLAQTVPGDLALDEAGNIYVLLNFSPDNSAVFILDPQGNLIRRFGQLTDDGSTSEDGIFFQPSHIAVTRDGNFLFIQETGFLTAYWLEPLNSAP